MKTKKNNKLTPKKMKYKLSNSIKHNTKNLGQNIRTRLNKIRIQYEKIIHKKKIKITDYKSAVKACMELPEFIRFVKYIKSLNTKKVTDYLHTSGKYDEFKERGEAIVSTMVKFGLLPEETTIDHVMSDNVKFIPVNEMKKDDFEISNIMNNFSKYTSNMMDPFGGPISNLNKYKMNGGDNKKVNDKSSIKFISDSDETFNVIYTNLTYYINEITNNMTDIINNTLDSDKTLITKGSNYIYYLIVIIVAFIGACTLTTAAIILVIDYLLTFIANLILLFIHQQRNPKNKSDVEFDGIVPGSDVEETLPKREFQQIHPGYAVITVITSILGLFVLPIFLIVIRGFKVFDA